MKKSILIVLVIAGLIALALGIRGGWAMGNAYFELKERRGGSAGHGAEWRDGRAAPHLLSWGVPVNQGR